MGAWDKERRVDGEWKREKDKVRGRWRVKWTAGRWE